MTPSAFRDNVVVLTGGSSGIGLEIALQLAAQRALLVLAARDPALLEKAAAACRDLGTRAIAVPTDVSDRTQCERLIAAAISEFGRLDTLVNNAGISMHARFDELANLDSVDHITRINYLGSVYCTHYALPHLKRTRGRIVVVSSLSGKIGVPTRSVYAATKHALAGFFDSLRIELEADRVSVTVVYPGFVATDIAERALGPGGVLLGTRPVSKRHVMSAAECARRTIDAAASRSREVVMLRAGRLGQLLRVVAPRTVDRLTRRTVERGR